MAGAQAGDGEDRSRRATWTVVAHPDSGGTLVAWLGQGQHSWIVMGQAVPSGTVKAWWHLWTPMAHPDHNGLARLGAGNMDGSRWDTQTVVGHLKPTARAQYHSQIRMEPQGWVVTALTAQLDHGGVVGSGCDNMTGS